MAPSAVTKGGGLGKVYDQSQEKRTKKQPTQPSQVGVDPSRREVKPITNIKSCTGLHPGKQNQLDTTGNENIHPKLIALLRTYEYPKDAIKRQHLETRKRRYNHQKKTGKKRAERGKSTPNSTR